MLVPFTSFALHLEQLDENLAVIILGSFLYWLILYYRCPADLYRYLARLLNY